jgi:hypothetical protein
MFRLLLFDSGTRQCIAVHIVMSMGATGVVITIVSGSIVFLVNVGTAASGRAVKGNTQNHRQFVRRSAPIC